MRFIYSILILLATSACSTNQQEVLENTWKVESYKTSDADSLKSTSQTYTLSFADRKNFSFQLDVNSCGGSVDFKPNNIVVFGQSPICTEACCDGAFALGVLAALKQVNRFELINERLTLSGNNGLRIDFVKR